MSTSITKPFSFRGGFPRDSGKPTCRGGRPCLWHSSPAGPLTSLSLLFSCPCPRMSQASGSPHSAVWLSLPASFSCCVSPFLSVRSLSVGGCLEPGPRLRPAFPARWDLLSGGARCAAAPVPRLVYGLTVLKRERVRGPGGSPEGVGKAGCALGLRSPLPGRSDAGRAPSSAP